MRGSLSATAHQPNNGAPSAGAPSASRDQDFTVSRSLARRGAYSAAGYVAFRIYEPDGVAHAIAAVRKVKRQPQA